MTHRFAAPLVFVSALAALSTLAPRSVQAQGSGLYTITALTPAPQFAGQIGGYAHGINNAGQVTGLSQGSPFLWTPAAPNAATGSLARIPVVGYAPGTAINAGGQVTGFGEGGAFLTDTAGVPRSIGPGGVSPNNNQSAGYAVNNSGQVAGTFIQVTAPYTRYSRPLVVPAGGTIGASSITLPLFFNDTDGDAFGLNSAGVAVGSTYVENHTTGQAEPLHAVEWKADGSLMTLQSGTAAYAINDAGLAVGTNGGGAVEWDTAGRPTVLGAGTAKAINGRGQVVGGFGTSGGAFSPPGAATDAHQGGAFLYTPGVGQRDLNTLIDANSGWTLGDATGINDSGQIVGAGFLNGVQFGYLLTPAHGNSCARFAAGGGSWGGAARCRAAASAEAVCGCLPIGGKRQREWLCGEGQEQKTLLLPSLLASALRGGMTVDGDGRTGFRPEVPVMGQEGRIQQHGGSGDSCVTGLQSPPCSLRLHHRFGPAVRQFVGVFHDLKLCKEVFQCLPAPASPAFAPRSVAHFRDGLETHDKAGIQEAACIQREFGPAIVIETGDTGIYHEGIHPRSSASWRRMARFSAMTSHSPSLLSSGGRDCTKRVMSWARPVPIAGGRMPSRASSGVGSGRCGMTTFSSSRAVVSSSIRRTR